MRVIKAKNFSKSLAALIIANLKNGKVIVFPTDTVYGLGCRSDCVKAINKIYKIKARKNSPCVNLVSSLEMAKKYCYLNKNQADYLKKIWPGPVTVILKSKGNLPEKILGKNSGEGLSLAIRLPKNKFLVKIINEINKPVVSTSLNLHGQKNLVRPVNLEKYFKTLPDLVIDAGVLKGKASRIVDIRDINDIKILR